VGNVIVTGRRTRIEPPVIGICYGCSTPGAPLVAGYYLGGTRSSGAPWQPVCERCDERVMQRWIDEDREDEAAGRRRG